MTDENKSKTDDVLRLIAEGDQSVLGSEKIENPFAEDEIVFKDENGNIKILKGDEILDLQTGQKEESIKDELKLEPVKFGGDNSIKEISEQESKKVLNDLIDNSSSKDSPIIDIKNPAGEFLADIKKVKDKSGINFSDKQFEIRFENIVLARLKGVRNQAQTREAFLKPVGSGGVDFKPEDADRVLKAIAEVEKEKNSLKVEPEKKDIPDLVFKKPEEKKIEQVKLEDVKDEKPKIKENSFSGEKPKIQDVKFKPKLTGPVEEIRSITLVDFRRLGKNVEEIMDKILEKINTLEEESFSKRIQAVKAWKESPVYVLYLDMGSQSMEEKRPIVDVVEERKQSGQEFLSPEEFEMISDLNKTLRY